MNATVSGAPPRLCRRSMTSASASATDRSAAVSRSTTIDSG
nr:hypothetical protein [Nocardiopsis alba]